MSRMIVCGPKASAHFTARGSLDMCGQSLPSRYREKCGSRALIAAASSDEGKSHRRPLRLPSATLPSTGLPMASTT
ncbi:hypothetical protein BD779DRAFT_1556483 [Infundibulicybe gibba]|nr:hypothetical protein BD779DRAFT_1556483 [Infundibulicybe gibba]